MKRVPTAILVPVVSPRWRAPALPCPPFTVKHPSRKTPQGREANGPVALQPTAGSSGLVTVRSGAGMQQLRLYAETGCAGEWGQLLGCRLAQAFLTL